MGTVNLDAVRYWTGDSLTPAELAALYAEELPVISAGGVIGKPPYHKTRLGTGQYDNVDGVLSTNAKDNWGVVGNVNGDTAADTRIRLQPTTTSTPLEYWLSRLATLNSTYSPTGSQWLDLSGTTDTGDSSGDAYEAVTDIEDPDHVYDFDATITTPSRGKLTILARFFATAYKDFEAIPYFKIGSGAQFNLPIASFSNLADTSTLRKFGTAYLDWVGAVTPSVQIGLVATNGQFISPFNDAISGWSMDGVILVDRFGENHLTTSGSAVAGLVGNGQSFTAADTEKAYRQFPTGLDFGNTSFSIAGWVNLASKTATGTVISKWNTSELEFTLYYNQPTDRFIFAVSSDGSTPVTVTASTFGAPSASTWYFLYAYHDADNNVIGISVNNGTADTTAHTTGIYAGLSDINIGADTNGTANFIDGIVDEIAIYNRTLTAANLTLLYASGSGYAHPSYVEGLGCDFITLLPEPSAKITIDSTPSLSSGDRLNITGKTALVEDASASYTQLYGATHEGEPITVEPGQYNVITLMQADEGAAYLVAATAIVDIDIIPRWTMPGGLVA